MKKILCSVAFLLTIFAVSAQNKPVDTTATAMSNLNRIENLYFKYLSSQERQEATRLLNETRGILVGIQSSQDNPSKQNDLNILSDESLQSLLSSIKSEGSDLSKTKIVLTIGKNGRITAAQLEKIVALYTFDNYREDLIRNIIDNVVDPVNMALVLRHFDNSITRDNLGKWLQSR